MKHKILEFKSGTTNDELEMAIRGEFPILSEGKKYQLHLNETELKAFERAKQFGYAMQAGMEWEKQTQAYRFWCEINHRAFVLVNQKGEFSTIFWDTITVQEVDGIEIDVSESNDIEKIPNAEAEQTASKIFSILNETTSKNISAFQEIEFFLQNSKFYQVEEQVTTKESLVQSRIGQWQFRAALIEYWQCCSVTGCKQIELLKASHIKPWRYASNQERLNVFNGLLLLPNLDTCFDLGLISFDDEGKILISSQLRKATLLQLGINENMKLTKVEKYHQEFLKYHRESIFRVK
jgi:hypothetical protein